jgi:crossover junction endodeoxyribonuclease RuvC
MIVIGIDPGTRHLGWGVIAAVPKPEHVASGVIELSEQQGLALRLVLLERELQAVIERYRPQVGSVESLFFHKDAQAAAKLGHARGVVLLVLARNGVEVNEYPPARVKLTVAGSGRADKRQMVQMVQRLLGLTVVPREDAADALAIALTHLRRAPVLAAFARAQSRVAHGKDAARARVR